MIRLLSMFRTGAGVLVVSLLTGVLATSCVSAQHPGARVELGEFDLTQLDLIAAFPERHELGRTQFHNLKIWLYRSVQPCPHSDREQCVYSDLYVSVLALEDYEGETTYFVGRARDWQLSQIVNLPGDLAEHAGNDNVAVIRFEKSEYQPEGVQYSDCALHVNVAQFDLNCVPQ